MPIAFRVVFLNLYLRDTHILGIGEAAMTHIVHGASMIASCYAGDSMWRCDYRKSDYAQTAEKRTGETADTSAECAHRVPAGCHLRNWVERGAV